MGNNINKAYLSQEQKVLLNSINNNKSLRRNAAQYARTNLVASVQKNISQIQNSIKDPNIQETRRQQLVKQLQIKKKNLQAIKKISI